jgi:hypothetical protein
MWVKCPLDCWSILKRGIMGSYHKVSRKCLSLYVAEFQERGYLWIGDCGVLTFSFVVKKSQRRGVAFFKKHGVSFLHHDNFLELIIFESKR